MPEQVKVSVREQVRVQVRVQEQLSVWQIQRDLRRHPHRTSLISMQEQEKEP